MLSNLSGQRDGVGSTVLESRLLLLARGKGLFMVPIKTGLFFRAAFYVRLEMKIVT